MDISRDITERLMKFVRVKSSNAAEEINVLAEACVKDLEIAGVYCENEDDALYVQALRLYCKAHYGYDKDSGKFAAAYSSLKDSMALSGDYTKKGTSDKNG